MNKIKILKKIFLNIFIIIKDFFNIELIKLIILNRKLSKKYPKQSNVILFDFFRVLETEIIRSYLLRNLSEILNASIHCYITSPFNRINYRWLKYYKSFGTNKFVYVNLNKKQNNQALTLFNKIIKNIRNKNDLFNLTIFNVHIGVDIYEEYMMKYQKPTFEYSDVNSRNEIFNGIKLLVFWKDYFETNNVKAIVASHLSLRFLSLPAKIGGAIFDIPFYSAHSNGINYIEQPHKHSSFIKNIYLNYPIKFNNLSEKIKSKAKKTAKQRINSRLSGNVGVDMNYSTKSAFHKSKSKKQFLISNSNNIKIVVCTHEFYDSPNSFGELLFNDFYDWLIYLIQLSEKLNYEWYIKLHPDTDFFTVQTIENLFINKKKFKVLNSDISFHEIYENNIKIALTCYGSIGHELPLLGFSVINAGTNPHIGYNFNENPKNLEGSLAIYGSATKVENSLFVDDVVSNYVLLLSSDKI